MGVGVRVTGALLPAYSKLLCAHCYTVTLRCDVTVICVAMTTGYYEILTLKRYLYCCRHILHVIMMCYYVILCHVIMTRRCVRVLRALLHG